MEIKVLVLLFAFFGSTLSQSISCQYRLYSFVTRDYYGCILNINNPNGWDNFTQIEGFHFPGLNNVFVTAIIRETSNSITRNVPQILCSQFPHATFIVLSSLNIEELSEFSFRGCRNLDYLKLNMNRISQVPGNLFNFNRHLDHLDFESNSLTTLPENLLENQLGLRFLNLGNNPFENLPGGIFRNLWNLEILHLRATRLSTVNPTWFRNLINLKTLDLSMNNFTRPIPADSFQNLARLWWLYLTRSGIREVNPMWFRGLLDLRFLYMKDNSLTSLPANSFGSLRLLGHLDLGANALSDMSGDAFVNLNKLYVFNLENNQLTRLHPRWFEDKPNLEELYLSFNSIASLPSGIFSQLSELRILRLWSNRIETINRNAFGSMQNLWHVDFDENQINTVDERFLLDSQNLFFINFKDNQCANETIDGFYSNREAHMKLFEKCMNNFRFVIDTQTQPNANYNFFAGLNPGMKFEINSDEEVSIALTPIDMLSNPVIEIFIANNVTRIVQNQEAEVVIMPSQGILEPGQWSRFRVTWVRNNILVFEDDADFPFISYSMRYIVPINFYGLRSRHSNASWVIEPIHIPPSN